MIFDFGYNLTNKVLYYQIIFLKEEKKKRYAKLNQKKLNQKLIKKTLICAAALGKSLRY